MIFCGTSADRIDKYGLAPARRITNVADGIVFVDIGFHFCQAVENAKPEGRFYGGGLAPSGIVADVALTVQFADFPLVFYGATGIHVVHCGVLPCASAYEYRVFIKVLFAAFRRWAGIVVGFDPFLSVATVIVSLACDIEVAKATVCRGIANGKLLVVFNEMRNLHATEGVVGAVIGFGESYLPLPLTRKI